MELIVPALIVALPPGLFGYVVGRWWAVAIAAAALAAWVGYEVTREPDVQRGDFWAHGLAFLVTVALIGVTAGVGLRKWRRRD